ncbi:hypothetical protein B0A48_12532 [Cryoendolithus antarcticus]|uniref:Cellulase n=1 Tax=Cryoendolithus antarcticus TaxID=1507870 RepID=A0A1V8SSR5_9PEZI|nr:hypothetical protein B0A48_12532 [Cryoendolithus antarcticus]
MSSIKSLAFLALAIGLATVSNAQSTSGSGTTTRYWDCCKASCSWPGKASVSSPVALCDKNDSPLSDYNTQSACAGGSSYMCSSQSPWAVSDSLAYGFAAVSIPSGSEATSCCSCYELTFTSTSIAGKKMIVQATNTGSDLGQGQFDLAIPGGGVGIFNACTDEWGAPASGWGAQYGGISSNTCSTLPSALQSGCGFRFGDWFEGADNPAVDWKKVTCPKAITDKTGCVRDGETPTGDSASTAAAVASSATPTSVAASSAAAPSVIASSAAASSAAATSAAASSAAPSSEVASAASSAASSVYTPPAASSAAPTTTSSAYVAPVASPSTSSVSAVAPVASSASSSAPYLSNGPTGAAPGPPPPASKPAAPGPPPPASKPAAPAPPASAPAPPASYPTPEGACAVQYVYEE